MCYEVNLFKSRAQRNAQKRAEMRPETERAREHEKPTRPAPEPERARRKEDEREPAEFV